MKILIVSQYFWPENFKINDLAAELARRGHEVTVLTGLPNYPEGRFFPGYGWNGPSHESRAGVEVIRVPLLPRGKGGGLRLSLNYLSFVLCGSLKIISLRKRRFDTCLVFSVSPLTMTVPAIALKKLSGVPIANWILDLWPEAIHAVGAVRSKRVLQIIDRISRWIYRNCDLLLVQSEAYRPLLLQRGGRENGIIYFPNWAEPIYEEYNVKRQRDPEKFRVVFAGNVGHAQNLDTVLTAAVLLKDEPRIEWVIAGNGSRKVTFEKQVAEHGLASRFTFLGQRPAVEMPGLFATADALLVSLAPDPLLSLTVPGKIQAYLACGIPVLGCLDGEGARILKETGGSRVASASSPEQLADAIRGLAQTSVSEREEMGRKNRAYYDLHFKRTFIISKLERALQDLVRVSKPANSS